MCTLGLQHGHSILLSRVYAPCLWKVPSALVHYATVVTTSIGVKRFEWGETRPVYRGGYFVTWQEREDSNPGPSVLETDALPAELRS